MNFLKFFSSNNIKLFSYLFYGGNLIYWFLGWASLGIGIWLYTDDSYNILVPNSFTSISAAALIICIGVMVIIISLIGCIAVRIQSESLLFTYFFFICILLFVQSVTGVLAYFNQDSVRTNVKYSLYETINRPYVINYRLDDDLRITWDLLQSQLHCCGINNYTDWFNSIEWPNHQFVPDSCCNVSVFNLKKNQSLLNCGKNEANKALFYKKGCFDPFSKWLLKHLSITGFISLVFIIVEIFIECIALNILYYLHKKEKRRRIDRAVYKYNRNTSSIDNEENNLFIRESNSI